MNSDNDRKSAESPEREDLIEGRNAVLEAIRAGRTIDKLFAAKGDSPRVHAPQSVGAPLPFIAENH